MRPCRKQLSRGFQRSRITMMPEGPEVKTLVDQLQGGVGKRLVNLQFVSGRYTTHGKPSGFEDFRNTMTSYLADTTEDIDVVTSWNCKGKFIWLSLDQGKKKDGVDNSDDDFYRSIWITLGMSGRFVRDTFNVDEDDGTTHKQPRWYFEFLDEGPTNPEKQTKKVYYYDTRNFGTLKFSLSKQELVDKLNSLGPDILDDEISPELFLELFRKPRQSMNLSKFLMDQKKIAGVGNYILAEVLFRAKLDPWASLDEISDIQARALYDEIIDVATSSYQKQGMTRRGGSYRDVDGNEGGYTFSLLCYGQEISPDGEIVIRNTNGPHGRTIWYVESQLFMPLSERLSKVNDKSPTPKTRKMKPAVEYEYVPRQDKNVTLVDALECESWKNELSTFLGSEKFDRLSRFVQSERRFHTVYPLSQDVFAALNKCPFDKVKVVIIGQDPYHGMGQAHGLSFSVQKGMTVPPSLKNIYKELNSDLDIEIPDHGNLEKWAEQGVLLLNAVSTVREGKANSHAKMGWEDFSDEVVEKLNEKKEGIVFLLWGKPAQMKGSVVDKSKHKVIATSHPSPLGATKTAYPFLGSHCFSRCNAALQKYGKEPIDWNVD